MAAPAQRRQFVDLTSRGTDAGVVVWIVVALLVAYSSTQSELFLTSRNAANALSQMVPLGLAAIGQTFAILGGAIDLSVGSNAKLATVLTAGLIDGQPGRVVPVVALVIGIGALAGFVNGTVATRLRIPPIIVTLGTFSILEGLTFWYTTTPVGSMPPGMTSFAYGAVGPVPYLFLLLLAVAGAAGWTLRNTTFGTHLYAVGGDRDVARRAGITTDRVTVAAMTLCGTLAASAGVMQAMRAGVGTPTAGAGLELASITAVVVGGASLFGGRGRIIGTLGGVALLGVIANSLNLLGVSSFSQDLVRGVVIVLAVAIFTRKD